MTTAAACPTTLTSSASPPTSPSATSTSPAAKPNLGADTQRYFIGLALAPTDNFITEFLPDLARRIHIRVVLVQRIVDQVARQDSVSP